MGLFSIGLFLHLFITLTTSAGTPVLQARLVDRSPLSTTIMFVLYNGCYQTSDDATCTVYGNSDLNIAIKTASASLSSINCGDLFSGSVSPVVTKVGIDKIVYVIKEVSFSSSSAFEKINIVIPAKCVQVLNSSADKTATPNAGASVTSGSTATCDTFAEGLCFFGSDNRQTIVSTLNYPNQNTPFCKDPGTTGAGLRYLETSNFCLTDASTQIDTFSPVLMLIEPYQNQYNELYLSSSTTEIKFYFNEAVSAGTGNICLHAYTPDTTYDSTASICQVPTSTGNAVKINAPTVQNRKYYISFDSTAVKDSSGNYFPGFIGMSYSSEGTIVGANMCLKDGTSTDNLWPAKIFKQSLNTNCMMSFIKPAPALSTTNFFPPHVSLSTTSTVDTIGVSTTTVVSDTTFCIKGASESFYKYYKMDAAPDSSTTNLQVMYYINSSLSSTIYCSGSSNSVEKCSWIKPDSSSFYVATTLSSTTTGLTCMFDQTNSNRYKSICCNTNSNLRFGTASKTQLVKVKYSTGALGFHEAFEHNFIVNATDVNLAKREPVWISWAVLGIDSSYNSSNPLIVKSFDGSAFSAGVKPSASGYISGLHVQYNTRVAASTSTTLGVRFIPYSILREYDSVNLNHSLINDTTYIYSVDSTKTAADRCNPTATVTDTSYGLICRILIASPDTKSISLFYNDHLFVDPGYLIPGERYRIVFDAGLVTRANDKTAISAEFSFDIQVALSVDWTKTSHVPNFNSVDDKTITNPVPLTQSFKIPFTGPISFVDDISKK